MVLTIKLAKHKYYIKQINSASTSCTPNNHTNSNDGTCWNENWTRMDVYRLFLVRNCLKKWLR